MMRSIVVFCAAVGALAASSSPAQAKGIWSCQYAKDRLLLTATMHADPTPPGVKSPATDLVMKGNVQLVLSQVFSAPGKADSMAAGGYRFNAYVKDNGATIVFGPDRQMASSEWLIDRHMPSGSFSGMFMNRAVADGIGRPMTADFGDLTSAAPPEYLHFRFMLPPSFYETKRYFARIAVAEFKALHAKGLAKAQTAKVAELKAC